MRHSTFAARFLAAAALLALFVFSSWAGADWRSERQIAPGVRHVFAHREAGPWTINILQINLREDSLFLATTLANGVVERNATLSAMFNAAAGEQRHPLAAINGDYFQREQSIYAGDPVGLQIIDGELVSFPRGARSALFITTDKKVFIERTHINATVTTSRGLHRPLRGLNEERSENELTLYTPRFGATTIANSHGVEAVLQSEQPKLTAACEIKAKVVEINRAGNTAIPPGGFVLSGHGTSAWFMNQLGVGEEITISLQLDPLPEGSVVEALGGGPRLVHDGQVAVEWSEESFREGLAGERHPRTAVGFSAGSLYLVTVDGRQAGVSQGMTLYELARLMVSIGCTEAMNLDGGGSTEMLVEGGVANNPSDGQERPIANGLVLFSTLTPGVPTKMTMLPAVTSMLADGKLQFKWQVEDAYGKQCALPAEQVVWLVTPALGQVALDGAFSVTGNITAATTVEIRATAGTVSDSSLVRVYPLPATISVAPNTVRLRPGQSQQFVVEGKAGDGSQIPSLLLSPAWSCAGGGVIDSRGYFFAGSTPGTLNVNAQLGNAVGQAQVIIEPAEQAK